MVEKSNSTHAATHVKDIRYGEVALLVILRLGHLVAHTSDFVKWRVFNDIAGKRVAF